MRQRPFINVKSTLKFNVEIITVVLRWYFRKVSGKWSEEASVFSTLQIYENIHEGFSVTLKTDFCSNVILWIFFLVESCFIEFKVLLPVTLQKEFPQVSFRGIYRTNTLQRCIQIKSNISDGVYCKNSLYFFWLFSL